MNTDNEQMPTWWERIYKKGRRLLQEWCFWDGLGQSCFFMCKGRRDDHPNMVIALQDYFPIGEEDLALQKGQQYVLIDSSSSEWWALRNSQGWGSHCSYYSLRGKFIRAQRN